VSDTERPTVFYLSVHSDPKVYVAPFKKVVSTYALYENSGRGRKAGKTYTAAQAIAKIAAALLDCGAIPVCGDAPRAPNSGRPLSFFVTQLDEYWQDAIADLDKVGVRIYVMPFLGAVEGLPDALADSFSQHYDAKFTACYEQAKRGVDALPLIEVLCSFASLFEPTGLALTPKHLELIEKTKAQMVLMREQAEQRAATLGTTPAPSPEPALFVPEIADDF